MKLRGITATASTTAAAAAAAAATALRLAKLEPHLSHISLQAHIAYQQVHIRVPTRGLLDFSPCGLAPLLAPADIPPHLS